MNCSKKADTNEDLSPDSDDNGVGSKIMLDGQVWMAENLSVDIAESYCQQDDSLHCIQYGRLYTWEAASKGCAELGEGWRLPTNEEWQTMAKAYGGVFDDSPDKGESAFVNLLKGGNSEFNALLGGNREENGVYARLGAHGFYWTATEKDSAEAWLYNFGKGSARLYRNSIGKKEAMSVRCIQNKP